MNEKLKEYRNSQKDVHNKEVDEKISDSYGTEFQMKQKLRRYNEIKQMKWWSWLIVFAIVAFGVGMTWLVGWLALNSSKAGNWKATGWFSIAYILLLILIWWILGFIRNKEATKFFNDRRRRYQKTLEDWEAKLLLIKKILLISITLFIPIVITTNIIY